MTWQWTVRGYTGKGPLTLTVQTAEKDEELAKDAYRRSVQDLNRSVQSIDEVILNGRNRT